MKIRRVLTGLILSALLLVPMTGIAAANVPGIAIIAPPPPPAPNVATEGSAALVEVLVSHRDTLSPPIHYVDSVRLFDGDRLIKEWKYTQNTVNSNVVFNEKVNIPARSDMDLKAVAHCTVHGYNFDTLHVAVLPQGTTTMQMMQTNADKAGKQVFGYPDISRLSDILASKDQQFIKNIMQKDAQDIQRNQEQMMTWAQSQAGMNFIQGYPGTAEGQKPTVQARQPGTGQQMMPNEA